MNFTPRPRRSSATASVVLIVAILAAPTGSLAQDDEGLAAVELRDGTLIRGRLVELRDGVFRLQVDDELREIPEEQVRRIDLLGEGPLLVPEDVLPGADRVPWATEIVPKKRLGRRDLDGALAEAQGKRRPKPDDTLALTATAGALEWRRVVYVENRLSRTSDLWVGHYESTAAAAAALPAWRAFAATEEREEGVIDVLHVRNITITAFVGDATRQAQASLRAAIHEKCSEAAPGEVRRFTVERPFREFAPHALLLPEPWRPAEVASLDLTDDAFLGLLDADRRSDLAYRGDAGVVRIRYEPQVRADERPYACETIVTSWRWGERAVLVLTEGTVTDETAAAYADFIADELARRPDTRRARRVAAEAWPPVPPIEATEAVRLEAGRLVADLGSGDVGAAAGWLWGRDLALRSPPRSGDGSGRWTETEPSYFGWLVRSSGEDEPFFAGARLLGVTAVAADGVPELAARLPAGGFRIAVETGAGRRVTIYVTASVEIVAIDVGPDE